MIPLAESGRKRDGTRWRARIRPGAKSGLRADALYQGLGADSVPGYRWVEDGKWARCVAEGELVPVDSPPAYTTTWYRLRPEYAVLEPHLTVGEKYPSLAPETADGFVRLWIDGRDLEADVTHFLREER